MSRHHDIHQQKINHRQNKLCIQMLNTYSIIDWMKLSITRTDHVQNIPNNNKIKQPYKEFPPKIINSKQGFNDIFFLLQSTLACTYYLWLTIMHLTIRNECIYSVSDTITMTPQIIFRYVVNYVH
jgi:hypothetical protein